MTSTRSVAAPINIRHDRDPSEATLTDPTDVGGVGSVSDPRGLWKAILT